MEIITAGDGTAHVSSSDDGSIYAGIVGADCYVTNIGERLSCTMQGANTALVGTGVGFMFGRAFRITIPEEVTIQSGTQSQRRNDIICAHFATSSDGHESGELVVLKGTPTSGAEAEDPEIPSGDILEGSTEAYMPLWRIPLDGINVGEPEAMFNVMLSMAELRDSVSQMLVVRSGSAAFSITPGGYVTLTMDVADSDGLEKLAVAGFSTGGVAITVAQVQLSKLTGRVVMALNNTTNVQRSGTATVDVLCAAPL